MNYPAGASSLPGCPWNRPDAEDFGFDECSVCMRIMEFADFDRDDYFDERREKNLPVEWVNDRIACAGCAEDAE